MKTFFKTILLTLALTVSAQADTLLLQVRKPTGSIVEKTATVTNGTVFGFDGSGNLVLTPSSTFQTTGGNANFVFEGDSWNTGYDLSAGEDWPSRAMALSFFAGGTKRNLAVNGSTVAGVNGTTSMTARYASQVYPYRPAATGKPAYLFVLVGENDIFQGSSAATINTSLQSYLSTAKAAGFTVIAFTLHYSSTTSNSVKAALNQLIRQSTNWDYLITLDALVPAGDSAWYTASQHPSALTCRLIAAAVNGVMSSRSGPTNPQGPLLAPNGSSSVAGFGFASVPGAGLVISGTDPTLQRSGGSIKMALTSSALSLTGAYIDSGGIAIGSASFLGGYGVLVHRDLWGSQSSAYNMLNDSGGELYINAPTGKNIHVRINNGSDLITISGSKVTINNAVFPTNPTFTGGLNLTSARFGSAYLADFIGLGYAGFKNYSAPDYLILHGASGDAFFNVATGQTMQFQINKTTKLTFGSSGLSSVDGFIVATAGKGLSIKEGSNAKQGVATLSSGTVTVSNTSVTANSRIILTAQDNNSTGSLRVSARTAGTSFTITSDNAGDSGVVAYQIFEPAP